jgi:hypothetical protein
MDERGSVMRFADAPARPSVLQGFHLRWSPSRVLLLFQEKILRHFTTAERGSVMRFADAPARPSVLKDFHLRWSPSRVLLLFQEKILSSLHNHRARQRDTLGWHAREALRLRNTLHLRVEPFTGVCF